MAMVEIDPALVRQIDEELEAISNAADMISEILLKFNITALRKDYHLVEEIALSVVDIHLHVDRARLPWIIDCRQKPLL